MQVKGGKGAGEGGVLCSGQKGLVKAIFDPGHQGRHECQRGCPGRTLSLPLALSRWHLKGVPGL